MELHSIMNFSNTRRPWHGFWRDSGREKTRIFVCHVDISFQQKRCLNVANPKNSYSTLPKSENLRVYVEMSDRRRIQLIGSPRETIFDVSAQILKSFVFLTINDGFICVETDFTGTVSSFLILV